MKKNIIIFAVLILLIPVCLAQTVSDIDGNVYNTVTIANQQWMKDNLKVTHYLNGDMIPNVTDITAWSTLTTGARCYYANDSAANSPLYGALYNFFAATDSRKLCPANWHVPTNDEWTAFFNGGGTTSHFSSLTSGARVPEYMYLGTMASWWSSTAATDSTAWAPWYGMDKFGRTNQDGGGAGKIAGFSVHCIKDINSGIKDLNKETIVRIYPNPVSESLYVYSGIKDYTRMQLYNVIGSNILQRDLQPGVNNIDLGSIPNGIYIIKLIGADRIFQKKLIKE